jgi:hypothetical protein
MKSVPFVCNHNAGRSQMAQAFFERDAILDRYDDVPVPTLAQRQTRARLASESCDMLEAVR